MTKSQKRYKQLIESNLVMIDKLKDSNNINYKMIAAFYVQQTIEKTIKLKAEIKGLILTGNNILYLINECDKHNIKIDIPKLIRKNALVYTFWYDIHEYVYFISVNKRSLRAAYYCIESWLNSGDTGR